MIRRFELQRDQDPTGVSGTGVVAEGAVFTDGSAVVKWIVGDYQSSVIWPAPNSVEAIEAIHGHGGATRVVWIDTP